MKRIYRTLIFIFTVILLLVMTCCSGVSTPKGSVSENSTTNALSASETQQNDIDFSQLYSATYKSVISVETSKGNIGSGFIVDSDAGYAITSSTLYEDQGIFSSADCTVTLYDERVISAEFVSYDTVGFWGNFLRGEFANSDIALIKLDSTTDLPPEVTFTNSLSADYGENCYVIGTVSDQEDSFWCIMDQNIITKPRNSHASAFLLPLGDTLFDGSFDYLIQTGITFHSGNCGAPLFNEFGQVIGMMNVRALNTQTYQNNYVSGISFATPSENIIHFLNDCNVSVNYFETSDAASVNIVLNGQNISAARDRVAEILMDSDHEAGASDYFVADSSSEIVLAKQTNISATLMNAEQIADAFLSKSLKIVVYYEVNNRSAISEGSGFLVGKDGFVMTNLHVINKLAGANQNANQTANTTVDIENISVYGIFEQGFKTFSSGNLVTEKFLLFPMDVIGYHKNGDLAILKFKNDFYYQSDNGTISVDGLKVNKGFEDVCNFREELPDKGESVFAIGNALGYGVSIARGIVSDESFAGYYSEYGYNMIQTDCPINSGNSGGGLFDSYGNIVGINTLGLAGEAVSDYGYENVSWAIPAAFAKSFISNFNKSVETGKAADAQIYIKNRTVIS